MAHSGASSVSRHSPEGTISQNFLVSWNSWLDLVHFPDLTHYLFRVVRRIDGLESILHANIYEALARVVSLVALEQNLCAQQGDPSQDQYGKLLVLFMN